MVTKETLKKLNEKYGKKTIGEIEKEIKENNTLSLEARKEAIFALLYLRNSNRYKENSVYRKSSFENYLLGFYNIKLKTFMESVRAFDGFEKESIKYGVGLVSKVARKCGVKKQKQVLSEIQKVDKNLKRPIQRSQIETIIQKHAKPEVPKNDYKAMYLNEVRQHKATQERYQEALQSLKEAKKQIEKLKATVLELRPLRDMKEAILPFIVPEEKQSEHRAS